MNNERQCFQCFAAPSCSWRGSSRLMMGPRRFRHWWHFAFVLCAYGLVSASAESEYCHTWEPSTWPVEGWLYSGIHSYCNSTGQHESKLFTGLVQASRSLQIDGMIIVEGKIHSERCPAPAPRQKHPNSTQIILVQARTSSSQENEQACVRSHASRNALLSPRCSLTCSGAVPLRSRCTVGCQESTGPKSFPEQVWNVEHGNISTEFMKYGPLRRWAALLSCCTFVKLDLCPKRRITCFQGWDLSLGSFHAYSIRRGPPGMVHWGSAEHCGCQTWQSNTFLRSFTDQLAGCFSFVYCIYNPSIKWVQLAGCFTHRPAGCFTDHPSTKWFWVLKCTMSRHVPSSAGPMLGSGICHRNRGGDVGLPSVPQYLSVTSNTKLKTALVFVFERKIPSIAPYLALQENRDVTPAEITHGRRMETKGLSVPGVCGIVGKDLQSEISCPKGTSGPSRTPWKSRKGRSQSPRFSVPTLLGKMLRLRNSCLWICSVTSKQTWGTPDSDYISNSQEKRATQKRTVFFFFGCFLPPPLDGLSWWL